MDDKGLIALVDCQPENLVWVSGWYDAAHKEHTGWHLYQFGTRQHASWHGDWPAAMPVCRAPSYARTNHNPWKRMYGDPEEFDSIVGNDLWCHKCIVEIVLKFPHIFKEKT